MTYIVSITSQGQITLPVALRRKIGLKKRGKALVSMEMGKIMIEPVQDLLSLRGSLKTTKPPLTNEQMHEMWSEEVTQRYSELVKVSKNEK